MKKTAILLILISLTYHINAQFKASCIKISKMDFSLFFAGRTEITDAIIQKEEFIIETKNNSQTYSFSIDRNESGKEGIKFTKGSRVTFSIEGDKKFVVLAVPSLNGQRVDVKKYKLCDNLIMKHP